MKCINVFEKAINPRHSLVYVLLLMIAVAMFAPMGVQAQSTRTIDVTITTKDINDAQKVTNYLCHLAPTRSSNGSQRAAAPACDVHSSALPTLAPTGGASSPPFFHPADMTYNGGPVVQSAQFTNFYLNSTCTPKQTCWGNPEGFMPDYFASEFIHIDDQYVNATANGRYTLNRTTVSLTGTLPHTKQVSDTQAAVIAGVRALFPGGGGGGYNQVYDLFLPLGQDTCQSNGGCYSPDVPSTFTFCAYHSSMNAPDAMGATIHVLYTVMPYQRVPGCQVTNSPYPNGQLADSTNSVLSHEIEELISDPDGNAWWESSHSALHGSESGDICAGEAQKFNLNDKLYDIQLNYDNASHSCASKSSYPSPKCIVQLNKTSFVNNDQVIASVLQVVNPASTPVAAAYNLWIDIPGYEPFPFARGGSDGSVTFAAGTANYGPLTLFTVSSGLPRGNYNFGCRLDDPVTGATQGQTVVPFTIN